jgi:hypothetical protein
MEHLLEWDLAEYTEILREILPQQSQHMLTLDSISISTEAALIESSFHSVDMDLNIILKFVEFILLSLESTEN